MTALPAPMICPSCGAPNDNGSSVCRHCTFVLVNLPQVHAGFVLASRYEITSALGAGGMGIVYQAQDRLLNETVALKVLRPEVAATPDMAQRFMSEIKLARAVSHRNVCRIHEYGEDRGLRYISMAFVGGADLRRVLRERGPLAPALAFEVAIQATEGLEAVHEEGIVHRDLKPANITVDPKGVVRVMDFGLAKQSTHGDPSSGSAGQMVGTPDYMSPEQIRGGRLDPRSDVYAMGIVIFELFTGRTPFRADTPVATILRHLNDPPPLVGIEALPAAILPVLEKALQKEPGRRYSSAEALGRALDEARSHTSGAGEPDFASLFSGWETGAPADPAQSSPATASATQGLSQATWTTAVGRREIEAEAPAIREELKEARANTPVKLRQLAKPPVVTEPEEVGIEVPEPEPRKAWAPPPATRPPVPAAPIPAVAPSPAPVARRRPDETARLAPFPRGRVSPDSTQARLPLTAFETFRMRALASLRANPRPALLAAAVPVVLLVGLGFLRLFAAPHISSAEPARIATGGTVVLTGTGFAPDAEVLFSGQPGRVIEASPTRLAVALPELDVSWAEPERPVPVVARVGSRSSAPFDLTVYPFPWIRSVTPDTGIAGDTVTINGSGWPLSASVRFGKADAQILQPGYKSIVVRVPAVRPGANGSVAVVVIAGPAVSSPVQFRVGRAQP